MASKRITAEAMREAIQLLREHGTCMAAARAAGISRTTLQHRISMARMAGFDEEKPPPNPAPDPEQKPTFRVQSQKDDYGDYKVAAIGDAHDSPKHPDKGRFKWMGRWVADIQPDIVIQIGDMLSFDSLCSQEPNDSLRGKDKPSFLEDIASGVAALQAFEDGLGGHDVRKHVTLGNHEDRLYSFTDRTPETAGMMQFELDRLLGRFGWTYSPYGVPWFLGGVAFCHVPMTILGRPVGGEFPGNTVARKSTHDWVYGHTHKADVTRHPKLGVRNHVEVINLGCALPQGVVEDYARLSMTGWWWGVWELRLSAGKIASYAKITMDELEQRYGTP